MEDLGAASFTIPDELGAGEVLRHDLWQQDVILAGGRLPYSVDADIERQLFGAAPGNHGVDEGVLPDESSAGCDGLVVKGRGRVHL